jgi:glycine/D-amino acid oxidase-like deaminating enzyme
MKVIVIGAGALGVAVARQLAVAGEDVLLLDRQGAGTGTTATTFAWTNSSRKPDPRYHRLNLAGMQEHARLAEQLPGAPAYFPSGALQWADAAQEQRLADNVERLQSLGYPARWVTRDEASRLAGDLRVPATIPSIAHFPGEGYVLPDRFVRNLLADARQHGAAYAIGEVTAIDDRPDRVTVTLAGGETHSGDRAVLATGRWTQRLAARAGIDIPMVTDTGRGAPAIDLRIGIRSLPADGHTIAGYASPTSRIYCLVTHSGITLAPILGRLVAAELTTDQAQDLLTAFRPTRFTGPQRPNTETDQHATHLGDQ